MLAICKFQISITSTIMVLLQLSTISSAFLLGPKPVGHPLPKRLKLKEAPVLNLVVEIPMSSVQYAKPLDVKTGGKFYLETPMEYYAYSSSGHSNLHRVNIVYLMQSMYRANLMCFFLHFWSMKDPSVSWDLPGSRIPPPYWSKKAKHFKKIK